MIERVVSLQLLNRIDFYLYRFRFLLTYILIGLTSLLIEFVVVRTFQGSNFSNLTSQICGTSTGILFAFFMNVKFNFRIPSARYRKAFYYFVTISVVSASTNLFFKPQLEKIGFSYEGSRFFLSGCLFFFAYMMHRKFSFAHLKQVGVAIYATGDEDISQIWSKIKNYTDFIHVDIIDQSYNAAKTPKVSRFEVIKAYWPSKQIDVHIMSNTPSVYLDTISADLVIVHLEIEEDLESVLRAIHRKGMRSGISLKMGTPLEKLKPYLHLIDTVMLLTIPKPGFSGQSFDYDALKRIDEINTWPERESFTVCVDGGISEQNIGMLSVDKIVSGSSVLNNTCPSKQIMRLQTSSCYEKIQCQN
ncbi:GtrA family protein [Rhodopirellula sp.]|nr:GtrA family protein [Rhodopirellula sp.]